MKALSTRRRLLAASVLLPGMIALAPQANAQAFPNRPIRLVVPFPPGGSTDTVTRMVAKRLSEELGQPVIVDNKAGAGGVIGVKDVLRSPADGHTLLFTPMGPVSIAPSLQNTGYKASDLEPVAVLFRAPFFLMVPENSKFRTWQQLLSASQSDRPPMFGSSGNGALSHVLGEALNQAAGTKFGHVPYKGGAPLLQSLSSDEVQWALLQAADAKPLADAGRLRPLMVLSSARAQPWANTPTSEELGLKGLNLRMWNGVFAAAGTPPEVVEILNRKITAILAEPASRARLQAMVVDGDGDNSPAAFRQQIAREVDAFAKIIAATNLKAD